MNGPDALGQLRGWCLGDALPVWLETAVDPVTGLFREGLATDGAPLPPGRVRTRTVARLIYVFAHAATLGVAPDGGLAAAIRAGEALHRAAWRTGPGGYGRSIDERDSTLADPEVDLYDQSCVVLAFAWLCRATGDERYLARADAALEALDRLLGNPHGGWAEDEAGLLPRRQNGHMHLAEALIALLGCGVRGGDRDRLLAILSLLQWHFLDRRGMLREYFGPAWETAPAWQSDRLVPGHMAEWCWLLRCADRVLGTRNGELSEALLACALRLGRAPDDGRFLLDEVTPEGKPISGGRRLWPQAELIKAALVTGRTGLAARVAEGLFETYLARTPRGTWRDRFDLSGRMVAGTVPGSSLYHLWTVVAEMSETGDAGNHDSPAEAAGARPPAQEDDRSDG